MNAEILCVGTEILLGDITNTNATFLSRELAGKGINVFHHSVVGDNNSRLEEAFQIAASRSDLVILTGGLGPTYDDMTKELIAQHFERKLVLHEPSIEAIRGYFGRGSGKMTDNNVKQAMLPEGCIVMPNHNGTAPGVILEDYGGNTGSGPLENDACGIHTVTESIGLRKSRGIPQKIAILLPGPPREMRAMWEESASPYLDSLSEDTIVSHSIKLFGIGESAAESLLHEYLVEHTNPTVAPYAKDGECLLRVTAKARDRAAAEALLQPVLEELTEKLAAYVYGIDTPDLQTALVQTLKEKKRTAATAESFTGGLVAKRITDVSGASSVFSYGAVTYANEVKARVLGVSEATLAAHGAVSRETAHEMAAGIRRVSGADIGVATTGVAGPEPSEGKEVGTCFVAVSFPDPDGEAGCEGNNASANPETASAFDRIRSSVGLGSPAHWPRALEADIYRENGVITVVQELHLGRGRVDDRELIRFIGASHALNMARKAAMLL